jgi:hypothetical protein
MNKSKSGRAGKEASADSALERGEMLRWGMGDAGWRGSGGQPFQQSARAGCSRAEGARSASGRWTRHARDAGSTDSRRERD